MWSGREGHRPDHITVAAPGRASRAPILPFGCRYDRACPLCRDSKCKTAAWRRSGLRTYDVVGAWVSRSARVVLSTTVAIAPCTASQTSVSPAATP